MTYRNASRALTVFDDMIYTPFMGANLRSAWSGGWSIWCEWLPGKTMWSKAVTDDFGNLVQVAS